MFLSNQAIYTEKVTDLWFKATSKNETRGIGMRTPDRNGWHPDRLISTLGCIERYQFCNATFCTPLSGLYLTDPMKDPGLDFRDTQAAVFNTVWQAAWAMKITFSLLTLGEDILLAQRFIQDRGRQTSSPVYEDQWQREVESLHNLSLAELQRRVVEFALPPNVTTRPGLSSLKFLVEPEANSTVRRICDSLKIRSVAHTSFSVLGLSVIVVAGLLIILFNFWMEEFVFWLRSRSSAHQLSLYKTREWKEGHILEIQRAAFGRGTSKEETRRGSDSPYFAIFDTSALSLVPALTSRDKIHDFNRSTSGTSWN
jgi:hypothetical protein